MAVLPGTPPIEIVMKRSARARRFSLRVSRLDGRVTLTLPARAGESEAVRFLKAQEGWLRQTLAEMPDAAGEAVGIGAVLPVEGRLLRLEAATGRSVRVEGEALLVPGEPAGAGIHPLCKPGRAQLQPAHAARHAVALGILCAGWGADVFLAAHPRAAFGPVLCCGA
jgi:hypothetical protein